jgi:hypothetical protein
MELRNFIATNVRKYLNENQTENPYLRPLLLANGFIDKKNGQFKYKNFDLTIRNFVEYSVNGDYMVEVLDNKKIAVIDSIINNDEQGIGEGSKLLDLITKLADESETILQLIPKPIGNKKLNKKALVTWYKSRGFDFISPKIMQRNPR